MQEPRFVIVRTTLDDEEKAHALARRIVEARLAACAQCIPIHSTYRWQGALETANEILVLAKTAASLATRLTTFIKQAHPYEVPEILTTPILGGYQPYLDWIKEQTKL